jgi:hypothetical protein
MLERKDSLGDERPDYVIRHGEVIFPELDDILANSVGLGVAFPRIVSPIELGGIVGYVNWKINEVCGTGILNVKEGSFPLPA